MTQSDKILRHLRDFGSITPMEAIQDYSIMRLGARIYDLRKRGHSIISAIECGKNRYGEKTHWAKYTMIKEAGQNAG